MKASQILTSNLDEDKISMIELEDEFASMSQDGADGLFSLGGGLFPTDASSLASDHASLSSSTHHLSSTPSFDKKPLTISAPRKMNPKREKKMRGDLRVVKEENVGAVVSEQVDISPPTTTNNDQKKKKQMGGSSTNNTNSQNNNEEKKQKKRKKKKRGGGREDQMLVDLQTSLPINDQNENTTSILTAANLNPGVTLQLGSAIRNGPPPPSVTKSESSLRKGGSKGDFDSSLEGGGSSVVTFGEMKRKLMASSSRRSSRVSSNQQSPFPLGSFEKNQQHNLDEEENNGWGATYGGRKKRMAPQDEEEGGEDPTMTSHKNQSIPVKPHKPSNQVRVDMSLMTGGAHLKNPRDRFHPHSMIPPSHTTKLPPPPMGKVTGHGRLGNNTRKMGKTLPPISSSQQL